jgi:hypothetical protein
MGSASICGRTLFDDDGDPSKFVASDSITTYTWQPEDVLRSDWKDTKTLRMNEKTVAQQDLNGQVMMIFDGSDSYILANSGRATITPNRQRVAKMCKM